ncbi:MAG TPA: septation protein IspZ [Steroidobacteraceae bacterium]|nr:septation protein IspZ [Steroidobacteraceae bacterium]
MQPLFELAPLAAFLLAYWLRGIYVATAVLMVGMVALLLVDWIRLRRLPPMHLLSAGLVLLLGGATLLLRDTRFLKWKPTVFLWLVSLAAVASTWIGPKTLAQRLLQPLFAKSEQLPRRAWLTLNWLWAGFYLLLGALNLVVADYASERAWVYFKVFGLSAAFVVFAMAQGAWLAVRTESLAPSAHTS